MTATSWQCLQCGHVADSETEKFCTACGTKRGELNAPSGRNGVRLPELSNYATLKSLGYFTAGIGWFLIITGAVVAAVGVVVISEGGSSAIGGGTLAIAGATVAGAGLGYVILGQTTQCFVGIERNLAVVAHLIARHEEP